MPIFFTLGIGTLLLDFLDVFLGSPRAAGASLVFWAVGVLALGYGMDWDKRVQMGVAYAGMVVASGIAIAGIAIRHF